MTWGGLKGGISVALALSLPDSDWKPVILAATHMVVLFSIIVQGLTTTPLAKKGWAGNRTFSNSVRPETRSHSPFNNCREPKFC